MEIKILSYAVMDRRSVKGFVEIEFSAIPIVIRDIVLKVDEAGTYLQLPAKTYIRNGQKARSHIIDFPNEASYREFQTIALKKLEQYLASRGGGS